MFTKIHFKAQNVTSLSNLSDSTRSKQRTLLHTMMQNSFSTGSRYKTAYSRDAATGFYKQAMLPPHSDFFIWLNIFNFNFTHSQLEYIICFLYYILYIFYILYTCKGHVVLRTKSLHVKICQHLTATVAATTVQ